MPSIIWKKTVMGRLKADTQSGVFVRWS